MAAVYVPTLRILDLFPHDLPETAATLSHIKGGIAHFTLAGTYGGAGGLGEVEINLRVLLGLSRGNQSWFNSVKGPISVGEETHCDISFDCSASCPSLLLCLFHKGPQFAFICYI